MSEQKFSKVYVVIALGTKELYYFNTFPFQSTIDKLARQRGKLEMPNEGYFRVISEGFLNNVKDLGDFLPATSLEV